MSTFKVVSADPDEPMLPSNEPTLGRCIKVSAFGMKAGDGTMTSLPIRREGGKMVGHEVPANATLLYAVDLLPMDRPAGILSQCQCQRMQGEVVDILANHGAFPRAMQIVDAVEVAAQELVSASMEFPGKRIDENTARRKAQKEAGGNAMQLVFEIPAVEYDALIAAHAKIEKMILPSRSPRLKKSTRETGV